MDFMTMRMTAAKVVTCMLLASVCFGAPQEDETPERISSYSLEEIKYPSKRMNLADLNMCDLGWSGMTRTSPRDFAIKYEGSMECPPRWAYYENPEDRPPKDPTCLACIKESKILYSESVWDHYANQTAQQHRREMYTQWFRQAPCDDPNDVTCGKVAVVVAADKGYLPMLAHWWCNAHRQGLDPHQLVILAFDEKVKAWADQHGLLAVELELYGIHQMHVTYCFKWATFPIFLDLMAMGMHVIFNDVDIVWVQNMAARLPRHFIGRDLVSALAPKGNYVGLNSGVLSMRPTPEMIVFVETLMSAIPLFMTGEFGWGGDQNIWNNLLRHYAFRSLSWLPLSNRFVVRNGDKKFFSKEQTLAIHFLGGNKKGKMTDKLDKVFGDVFDASACLTELQQKIPK